MADRSFSDFLEENESLPTPLTATDKVLVLRGSGVYNASYNDVLGAQGVAEVAVEGSLTDLVMIGRRTGSNTPVLVPAGPIIANAVAFALANLGLPSLAGQSDGEFRLVKSNGLPRWEPTVPTTTLTAIIDTDIALTTIAEDAANGTFVGITAYSVHPGNTITYDLTDSASGKFGVNSTSGRVFKAGTLDYGTATSHNITVRATSSGGGTVTATYNIPVTEAVVSPGTGFVYRDGTLLKVNGTTIRFVGTNNISLTGCQSPLGYMTYAEKLAYFQGLRASNSITRIWCFNHSNRTDIDETIAAATAAGRYIIMCLFEGAGHCGMNYTANRAWYQNPANTYGWIDDVCADHADKTCIAWWECANEMGHASAGDMTQAECKAWLNAVGARIKLRAPNHLVGSGCIGSWKGYHSGQAGYQDVHNSIYIDIVSSHEYEYDFNGNTGVQGRHAQELAAAAALNKPLYIGEFGTSRTSGTAAATRAAVTLQKFDAYFNSSEIVCAVIHWATTKAYLSPDPSYSNSASEAYASLTSTNILNYTHTRLTGGGVSSGGGGGGGGGGTVYNTLTKTHRFDDAAWTKTNVTAFANTTATLDPFGGNNAEKIVETAVTGAHSLRQAGPTSANGAFVGGIYLKAAERSHATFHISDSATGSVYGIINLTDGTVTLGTGGSWTGGSVSTVSAGNGWWRVIPKGTRGAGTATAVELFVTPTLGFNNNYAGVAGSGIYVYGAGLEPGTVDHGYQEVN
jgi:hypothetical protein